MSRDARFDIDARYGGPRPAAEVIDGSGTLDAAQRD